MVALQPKRHVGLATGVAPLEGAAAFRAASVDEIRRRLDVIRQAVDGGTLSDAGVEFVRCILRVTEERLKHPEMRQAEQRVPGLGKD